MTIDFYPILKAFCADGAVVTPLGRGNINDTFLVCQEGDDTCFVLQRINEIVFPKPDRVVENFLHVSNQVSACPDVDSFPLVVARPLATGKGEPYFKDPAGKTWRAQSFLNKFREARIKTAADARRIGHALAAFHRVIRQIDSTILRDPLPGFHVLSAYLSEYDKLKESAVSSLPDRNLKYCLDCASGYRGKALDYVRSFLSDRKLRQPVHGDPKCDNFLFHESREDVAIIDLDTVGTGMLPYDLGDCLRSLGNRMGEEYSQNGRIAIDDSLCRSFAAGYREQTDVPAKVLQEALYTGLFTVTYELAVRFLTDHLAGNIYFKVDSPDRNLLRAAAQFRLLEDIQSKEKELSALLG